MSRYSVEVPLVVATIEVEVILGLEPTLPGGYGAKNGTIPGGWPAGWPGAGLCEIKTNSAQVWLEFEFGLSLAKTISVNQIANFFIPLIAIKRDQFHQCDNFSPK